MSTPLSDETAPTGKPWRVQLVCCGRDDGVFEFDSWSEADEFRAHYTDPKSGHDRQAIISATGDEPGPVVTDAVLAEIRAGLAHENQLAFAWAGAHVGHLRALLAECDALRGLLAERTEICDAQVRLLRLEHARTAAIRAEIAIQRQAAHRAGCGSPVDGVVGAVLDAVEARLTGAARGGHGGHERAAGGREPVERDTETAEAPTGPQEGAEGVSALCCACGAPAVWEVAYRGEAVPVRQCVRCAVDDKRTSSFHRTLTSAPGWLRPTPVAPEDDATVSAEHVCHACGGDGRSVFANTEDEDDQCRTCGGTGLMLPPIAPEDEGIATADILAQIIANQGRPKAGDL